MLCQTNATGPRMNLLIKTDDRHQKASEQIRSCGQLPAKTYLPSEKTRAAAPPDPICIGLTKAEAATFHFTETSIDAERERRRLEALKGIFGLWADRKDIPKDGVEYQRQLRAEWE